MQGTFNQLDESAKVELWSCMALRHTTGLGVRRRSQLRAEYGSAHAALLHCADWGRLGINRESIQAFKAEYWREPAKKEWAGIKKLGCGIITWEAFPKLLQEIHDPPLYLYYWGQPALLAAPHIAVVGSRRCSHQGLYNAALLARDLARAGFSVVSGLARGIDREAHLAALPEIGSSIAVLGTGIDLKYPKENSDAFDALAQNGLILSELPPTAPADPRNFPVRNRIISGISLGVVVIEAAGRSGSLITARHALEQNRQVYAVPGNPDAESSHGCQELLRNGAVLVRGVSDIIFDLKGQLKALTLESVNKNSEETPPVIPSRELLQEAAWSNTRDSARKATAQGKPRTPKSAVPAPVEAGQNKATSLPLLQAKEKIQNTVIPNLPETLSPLEAQVIGILRANPEGLQIDQITRLVAEQAEGATAAPDKQTKLQTAQTDLETDRETGWEPGTGTGKAQSLTEHHSSVPTASVTITPEAPVTLPPDNISGKLAGLLTMLEVAGKVACRPGLRYIAR